MIIETKFDVEDEVYTIHGTTQTKNETCVTCCGNKRVELTSGLKLECPACNGNGYINDIKYIYKVHSGTSTIIHFTFHGYGKNDGYIIYILEGNVLDALEKDLFKTKEEAQAECDRLNKEEVK